MWVSAAEIETSAVVNVEVLVPHSAGGCEVREVSLVHTTIYACSLGFGVRALSGRGN